MRRTPPKATRIDRRSVPEGPRPAELPRHRRGTGRPARTPRGAGLPRPAMAVRVVRPGARRPIAAEPGRPAKISRLPPGPAPACSARLRRARTAEPARRVPVTGARGPASAGGVPARLGRRVPRAVAVGRGVPIGPPASGSIPVSGDVVGGRPAGRVRPARAGRRIPRPMTVSPPTIRRVPVTGTRRPAPVRSIRPGAGRRRTPRPTAVSRSRPALRRVPVTGTRGPAPVRSARPGAR
jgi:hypothetical protein